MNDWTFLLQPPPGHSKHCKIKQLCHLKSDIGATGMHVCEYNTLNLVKLSFSYDFKFRVAPGQSEKKDFLKTRFKLGDW